MLQEKIWNISRSSQSYALLSIMTYYPGAFFVNVELSLVEITLKSIFQAIHIYKITLVYLILNHILNDKLFCT